MATKTTFIATAPDGTQIKRTSARTYTHAVLVEFLARPVGSDEPGVAKWGYLSFNGREELATKEAVKWGDYIARGRWSRTGATEDKFLRTLVVPVTAEG